MGLALTDTVASISGTNNEVLTMTIGGMTINAFKYEHIIIYGDVYIIASNTATTITLITETSAYDDFTGLEIEVHKNYANYKDIKRSFSSSDARGDGNALGDEIATNKEIIANLDDMDGTINEILNLDSETINTLYFVKAIKKIETDVISMMLMRGVRFRKNNPGEDATSYWSITPSLTPNHLRTLRRIKKKISLKDGETTYVYNIDTREEIT